MTRTNSISPPVSASIIYAAAFLRTGFTRRERGNASEHERGEQHNDASSRAMPKALKALFVSATHRDLLTLETRRPRTSCIEHPSRPQFMTHRTQPVALNNAVLSNAASPCINSMMTIVALQRKTYPPPIPWVWMIHRVIQTMT